MRRKFKLKWHFQSDRMMMLHYFQSDRMVMLHWSWGSYLAWSWTQSFLTEKWLYFCTEIMTAWITSLMLWGYNIDLLSALDAGRSLFDWLVSLLSMIRPREVMCRNFLGICCPTEEAHFKFNYISFLGFTKLKCWCLMPMSFADGSSLWWNGSKIRW